MQIAHERHTTIVRCRLTGERLPSMARYYENANGLIIKIALGIVNPLRSPYHFRAVHSEGRVGPLLREPFLPLSPLAFQDYRSEIR